MTTQVNPETGEIVDEYTNPYDGMADDDLLALLDLHRQNETAYRSQRQQAEYELTRRLNERSATVYVSPTWNVKLVPQVEYKYAYGSLSELVTHILPEEYSKVVQLEPKVNKIELNKLAKRGGEIKRIIDEATTAQEKAPRLEIRRVGE